MATGSSCLTCERETLSSSPAVCGGVVGAQVVAGDEDDAVDDGLNSCRSWTGNGTECARRFSAIGQLTELTTAGGQATDDEDCAMAAVSRRRAAGVGVTDVVNYGVC